MLIGSRIRYSNEPSTQPRNLGWPSYTTPVLVRFGLSNIRFVRLFFSAETVFFSHNILAKTVFFSQFQLRFSKPNVAFVNCTVTFHARSSIPPFRCHGFVSSSKHSIFIFSFFFLSFWDSRTQNLEYLCTLDRPRYVWRVQWFSRMSLFAGWVLGW